jgi:hypothetical protein
MERKGEKKNKEKRHKPLWNMPFAVVIPSGLEPPTPTLSRKVPKLDVFQNVMKNPYFSAILMTYFRFETGYLEVFRISFTRISP